MLDASTAVVERQAVRIVLSCAVIGVGIRLFIAGTTYGTDDVRYWTAFAHGVKQYGPIGIYGHNFEALYNHPPLAGWMLALMNRGQDAGIAFPFLIRIPASIADGFAALCIFNLLKKRVSVGTATTASVAFIFSPLGIIVSGFHGNTDPVFMALILGAFCVIDSKRQELAAGLLFALAISVKIVPIVLLPLLLLVLWRRGLRASAAFICGGAIIFAVLWVPVLLSRPHPFIADVLGYSGNGIIAWGLPLFASMLGMTSRIYEDMLPWFRYAALAAAALLPLCLWTKGKAVHSVNLASSFGLVMTSFLLLSPAFAMQYLVWGLASAYLVNIKYAHAYNASASVFAIVTYSLWNHALPWAWFEARSAMFPGWMVIFVFIAWLSLLGVILSGISRLSVDRRTSLTDRPMLTIRSDA